MPVNGPIIIIEDDQDDQEIIKEALLDVGVNNDIIFFDNGIDAMEDLKQREQAPFFIICDVNLPKQDGIEFKRELDNHEELRKKSIPFIFYTTYVSQYAVNEAYSNLTVQGFFHKSATYTEFRELIRLIVQYWKLCRHPGAVS
ncbi:MAG: response regulator [Ferruginibacter sp.]